MQVRQSYFTVRKRKKDIFRRTPAKRAHGEVIILSVWNRKYKLVTEVLVAKEENTDYRWLTDTGHSIWESKYRADCDNNYFTLIFNRSGTYKILFTKYYKWSAKYSMGPRELYITSEAGDTFTIVKFKNKIFMVYNNKYFEPSFNLH